MPSGAMFVPITFIPSKTWVVTTAWPIITKILKDLIELALAHFKRGIVPAMKKIKKKKPVARCRRWSFAPQVEGHMVEIPEIGSWHIMAFFQPKPQLGPYP